MKKGFDDVVRRRLTLKRIDPWSVLKFGFLANLSLLAIGLLGGAVIWFFVRRLELIEKVCSIALDVGFESCGVNGPNLFRVMLLLGLLGVVVATGLLVFLTFLANLITDLTGGLSFTFGDDTAGAAGRGEVAARTTRDADERSRRSTTARPPGPIGTQTPPGRGDDRSASASGGSGAARPVRAQRPAEPAGGTTSDSGTSGDGSDPAGPGRAGGASRNDEGDRIFGDRGGPGQR